MSPTTILATDRHEPISLCRWDLNLRNIHHAQMVSICSDHGKCNESRRSRTRDTKTSFTKTWPLGVHRRQWRKQDCPNQSRTTRSPSTSSQVLSLVSTATLTLLMAWKSSWKTTWRCKQTNKSVYVQSCDGKRLNQSCWHVFCIALWTNKNSNAWECVWIFACRVFNASI